MFYIKVRLVSHLLLNRYFQTLLHVACLNKLSRAAFLTLTAYFIHISIYFQILPIKKYNFPNRTRRAYHKLLFSLLHYVQLKIHYPFIYSNQLQQQVVCFCFTLLMTVSRMWKVSLKNAIQISEKAS